MLCLILVHGYALKVHIIYKINEQKVTVLHDEVYF